MILAHIRPGRILRPELQICIRLPETNTKRTIMFDLLQILLKEFQINARIGIGINRRNGKIGTGQRFQIIGLLLPNQPTKMNHQVLAGLLTVDTNTKRRIMAGRVNGIRITNQLQEREPRRASARTCKRPVFFRTDHKYRLAGQAQNPLGQQTANAARRISHIDIRRPSLIFRIVQNLIQRLAHQRLPVRCQRQDLFHSHTGRVITAEEDRIHISDIAVHALHRVQRRGDVETEERLIDRSRIPNLTMLCERLQHHEHTEHRSAIDIAARNRIHDILLAVCIQQPANRHGVHDHRTVLMVHGHRIGNCRNTCKHTQPIDLRNQSCRLLMEMLGIIPKDQIHHMSAAHRTEHIRILITHRVNKHMAVGHHRGLMMIGHQNLDARISGSLHALIGRNTDVTGQNHLDIRIISFDLLDIRSVKAITVRRRQIQSHTEAHFGQTGKSDHAGHQSVRIKVSQHHNAAARLPIKVQTGTKFRNPGRKSMIAGVDPAQKVFIIPAILQHRTNQLIHNIASSLTYCSSCETYRAYLLLSV